MAATDTVEAQPAIGTESEVVEPEPEALVDESFLLGVLRELVDFIRRGDSSSGGCAHGNVDCGEDKDQDEHGDKRKEEVHTVGDATGSAAGCAALDERFERRLESLWDLCVDAQTATFVVQHRAVAILAGAVARCGGSGRMAEVCLGALANVCTHPCVRVTFSPADLQDLEASALQGLGSIDGSVVVQALRVICALLCGSAALDCCALWAAAPCQLYISILERSLLWEAVQRASDALTQGLVLESSVSAGVGLDFSAAPLLVRAGLPSLLASRLEEVAGVCAGEANEGEAGDGDPGAALLSALRLGESLLAATPCSAKDGRLLGAAALKSLELVEQPQALAAALELLAACTDRLDELDDSHVLRDKDDEGAQRASCDGGVDTTNASELATLYTKMRATANCSPGLAEKLAMLFVDEADMVGDDILAVGQALALLQHAPRDEVAEHRRVFAEAAVKSGVTGTRSSSVSAPFLEWLMTGSGVYAILGTEGQDAGTADAEEQ